MAGEFDLLVVGSLLLGTRPEDAVASRTQRSWAAAVSIARRRHPGDLEVADEVGVVLP